MNRLILILVGALLLPSQAPAADDAKPKVHVVQGMWSHHWQIPDALQEKYEVTESFMTSRYGFVTGLKGFPKTREEFFRNDVVVLANIPADAFKLEGPWRNMQPAKDCSVDWIEEFVRQGGSLFLLGGNYSLGVGGQVKGTSLEKLLPMAISENDVRPANPEPPYPEFDLKPVKKHAILTALDWTKTPVTLFYHDVEPKPDAEVLVQAGEAPIMIAGRYGKGRVVVWLATLHGLSLIHI